MSFTIIPNKKLVFAAPVAPCFDRACCLSDLGTVQPVQTLGFVDPLDVHFSEAGALVHTGVGVCEPDGKLKGIEFTDSLSPFAKILQTGLDYYFSMVADPRQLKCTVYTEQKIVLPGRYARPNYGACTSHIDQNYEDLFEKGDDDLSPKIWSNCVMWSSDFPTEFYPMSFDAREAKDARDLFNLVSNLDLPEAQIFPSGTITLHTGAIPHRTSLNMTDKAVMRTWMLMVLKR